MAEEARLRSVPRMPTARWCRCYHCRPSRSKRSRALSSTTDFRERGQVLVLFAGAALTLFVVAALAFDTGMILVQRRDEQNAADAAALAGARYLPGNEASA